jgi:hypothetical protein
MAKKVDRKRKKRGVIPNQPTPGEIFEDILDDGLLDVILNDQNQATYVQIDSYDYSNGPGSMISEAPFSAMAGDQGQSMQVDPDHDFLGSKGSAGICNRYLYYSQADGTESGFSFGAYIYEDFSFGGTGGRTSEKKPPRISRISRCVNCRSEGSMPVYLYLNADDDKNMPIFAKNTQLIHTRNKNTPCCWFSRPGNLVPAPAPPDVFLILQKVDPKNWSLFLRSKDKTLATYKSTPANKYSKTFLNKDGTPRLLKLNQPDATYPLKVTVSSVALK